MFDQEKSEKTKRRAQRRERKEKVRQRRIRKIKKRISANTFKNDVNNKKDWYEIGRYLAKGIRIDYHNEMKLSARRTYQFYSICHGDWNGPSPRMFGKMRKYQFEPLLNERQGIQELEDCSDEMLLFSPRNEENSEQFSFQEGEDLSEWNTLLSAVEDAYSELDNLPVSPLIEELAEGLRQKDPEARQTIDLLETAPPTADYSPPTAD